MAQEILNTKPKEELLKTPINALGLEIVGSLLEPVVAKLYQELETAGIQFRPQIYVTDDWGCPDGIPIIGVPFYLAHAKLRDIEVDKMKTIESEDEIAQTMRHEAGHAFNYVYELYKLPKWQEVFGVYSKPYQDNFAPIAGSDKFVRHLEGWYAQKHPDEDFAETFAVILTPGFDWKTAYKGTPAFEKLTYVAELVKEYRAQAVPEPKKPYERDVPIESLAQTLEEWYRRRIATRHPSKKVMLLFYQEYPKKVATRDEVVGQIKEVLVSTSRYSVVLLPINQSVERIVSGIKEEKPDLIFNLCETFRDNDRFDFNVTALLELMQIPVTGSSSGGLFLSNDKHLSKKIFDYHRIPYPAFFLVPFGTDPIIPKSMKYPLFVKPVHEDASLGIDEHSLVKDAYALRKKVQEIHKEFRDDVLVEEYIDGREFFISVLGNKIPKPLEVLELDFSKLPSKTPHIYTHKAKIDRNSKEYALIQPKVADNIEPELWGKIVDLGVKVCKALGARDYARVDMRLSNEGKLYVLEANFNPYLAKGSETAIAAEAKGLDYHRLISTIVELALARGGK